MVKLSKETHLEMFIKMERIREFDSRINKLVRRGFVQGMTTFQKRKPLTLSNQHLVMTILFKSPRSWTIYCSGHGFE